MIRGMTGFGCGRAEGEGVSATADLRTVNHRQLDVELRGTPLPAALEARLSASCARALSRGKVTVHVLVAVSAPLRPAVTLDASLLRDYVAALRAAAREMGVAEEPSLAHLAALPWGRLFDWQGLALAPAQEAVVEDALAQALDAALAVRAREGEILAADLRARVASAEAELAHVRAEAERAAPALLERLRARMRELLPGVAVDEGRLLQEAALAADKADASEEITRLAAHLATVRELLASDAPAGKRLDFTLQEAFREANTLGAKLRGLSHAPRILEIKAGIERMREQAANVE